VVAFDLRLEQRLAALGNVKAASITTNPPVAGGNTRQLVVEGREPAASEQAPIVTQVMIGPPSLETIGLQLLRGRGFDETAGTAGHETAIVNQRFVAMHFAGEDPIGRRVPPDPEAAR